MELDDILDLFINFGITFLFLIFGVGIVFIITILLIVSIIFAIKKRKNFKLRTIFISLCTFSSTFIVTYLPIAIIFTISFIAMCEQLTRYLLRIFT